MEHLLQAKPSQAKPSQAKPSQITPNDIFSFAILIVYIKRLFWRNLGKAFFIGFVKAGKT